MQCKWQVEIDDYATKVLRKHWPDVPKYRDVREVGAHNLKRVRLVCGGFPCTDISLAGEGAGIIGKQSGLWSQFARILREIRPECALIENVPALRGRGLALVLQDLWALGFDAEWHCISAAAFGAPYERDRIFILAYHAGSADKQIITRANERTVSGEDRGILFANADTTFERCDSRPGPRQQRNGAGWRESFGVNAAATMPDGERREEQRQSFEMETEFDAVGCCNPFSDLDGEPLVRAAIARGERHAWTVEPGVVRMVPGVPNRVDRIRCLGNAVVPQVAEWIGRRIIESVI